MQAEYTYQGSELDLFAQARNWKRYFASVIRPYLRGSVLEVGAGIGATTAVLHHDGVDRWVCLEPDPAMARRIETGRFRNCEARVASLGSLPPGEAFDAILYIDVLEHIEHDAAEAELASQHLRPGGHLVVLAPANQSMFTPFDAVIGHYRRYSKETLRAVIPASLQPKTLLYLDSVGSLALLGNRLVLRSANPTLGQILFWDRAMVPLSRLVDPVLRHWVGRSVFGVWSRG